MKIYTKTGDQGETSLFSGERISKSDLRVEAYGTLDELNSNLGVVVTHLPPELQNEVEQIQTNLFRIGSFLASTANSPARDQLNQLTEQPIFMLEASIDRMTAELPPLTSFILPGGHISAATTHVARTVCRRTERAIARLYLFLENPDDSELQLALRFFNRLADYLFVLARYLNFLNNLPDKKLPR